MTEASSRRRKRQRPRVSIKTMRLIIALIACYVAFRHPTKRWGMADVLAFASSNTEVSKQLENVAPLIVKLESLQFERNKK